MLRGRIFVLLVALAVSPTCGTLAARAADLDCGVYGNGALVDARRSLPPASLGEAHVIVTSPPSVGGRYLPIPG